MDYPPKRTPESIKLPTNSLEKAYMGEEPGARISTENILFTVDGIDISCEATYEVKVAGAQPTFSLQKLILRNPKNGNVVDVKEIIGETIPIDVNFRHDPRARGRMIIANPFDGMPGLLTLLHEAGHIKQKDEPAFKRVSHGRSAHQYLHASLIYLDGKVELPRELKELKNALDGIYESDASEEAWKKYTATVVKGPFKDLYEAWGGHQAADLYTLISERDASLNALQFLKRIETELGVPMNPTIAKDVFPEKEKAIHTREEDTIDAKETFVAWLDSYRADRKTSGSLLKNFKDIQKRAEELASKKESTLGERLAKYRTVAET